MLRRCIRSLWGVLALALLVWGVVQLGPVWQANLINLSALDAIMSTPAFFSVPWPACESVPRPIAEKLKQHLSPRQGEAWRIISAGVAQLNCPLALGIIANQPADHAVDAFWQGYVLARAGRQDEAVRCWGQYPTEIGRYLFGLDNSDRAWRLHTALLLCRLGAQRTPQNIDAWQCLGEAAVQLGDWATAEQAFAGRLSLETENPNVLYWLGRSQRYAGKGVAASITLRQALELGPSTSSLTASIWYELGNAYLSLGEGRLALGAFERTKEIAPDFLYLKDLETRISELKKNRK